MAHPQPGDTITVKYTGRLDDGRVFDTSQDRGPLELTVGEQGIIPGVEEALKQMEPGEERTVTVPPEQAYGPRRSELVIGVAREDFPEHIQPTVGQRLRVKDDEGQVSEVTIAGVSGDRVTLDANHPLAGEHLTFDLELVAIHGLK
jgi:peptidylprolyl isomerase